MKIQNILKATVITEKSNHLKERENKYVFKVARNAGKKEIKDAIEKYYKVSVKNVNVLVNRGRQKKSVVKKTQTYRTSDVKKAIVELDSKDTLEIFKGEGK